jgi:hypothetical protein
VSKRTSEKSQVCQIRSFNASMAPIIGMLTDVLNSLADLDYEPDNTSQVASSPSTQRWRSSHRGCLRL